MQTLTLQKLKDRSRDLLQHAVVRATTPISCVFTCPGGSDEATCMAPAPSNDDPIWRALAVGERWGDAVGYGPGNEPADLGWGIPANAGSTHWLRATVVVPEAWRGGDVRLTLAGNAQGQGSFEGIVYIDGRALAGIDEPHPAIRLPDALHTGTHEVSIRLAISWAGRFGGLNLQLHDHTIFQLGETMQALVGAYETYRDSDPFRHTLLQSLNDAYNMLDLRQGWQSDAFATSAHAALDRLREQLAFLAPNPRPVTATITATGHGHLDVAWLWPLWRTRQKVAHTVANQLHLMDQYPEHHFSMSQPQVFAYLKQNDPDLYARMKQRVAEGRFEPVGMMWLEPDCNVTGGESLVRQLVHGARFFAEEFGTVPQHVWLPDVFGYTAALPQLMRGVGIGLFMTTKISWNQFNRMPNDTFRWRGIDGSEVLTHFVTASDSPVKHAADPQFYTYNGSMQAGEVFGTWNHYRQKNVSDEVLYIFGFGDGGGGPSEGMLERARALNTLPGFPRIEIGRAEAFFQRLYQRAWDNPATPRWVGELYLELHRGTYTSQGRTKQNNRAAELALREAEWLNAWAVVNNGENRQAQLDAAWELVLLNQFHDILPGSSVDHVYVDSACQFAQVQQVVADVRAAALAHLAANQAGILVINSLPWQRHEVVELPLDEQHGTEHGQIITNEHGQGARLINIVAAPYSITTTDNKQPTTDNYQRTTINGQLSISPTTLENDHVRVTLDSFGEVVSLFDKRAGRELALPGQTLNQLVAYEDRPINWDAWDIDLFYEEKPYPVRELTEVRVVEAGPLRGAVQITRTLGSSTITQQIRLCHDSARIDFVTTVDWQERQVLLRALFPLAVNTDKATCEIQFGAVERPTHRNTSWDVARFEVCAQRWVDLSEGGYGVALLNTGKYGHSLRGSTLGLSLLKSANFPDQQADRGQHRFTYSLLPHQGDWRTGAVVRRAYELNAPLHIADRRLQIADSVNLQSAISDLQSFISSPTDHIVVETVKVAHDGDGLIVRLYEAHNQRGPGSIVFDRPIASAVETDLLERESGAVEVAGNTVHFDVRPFEVKTLRVRLR